jgi:hypothetical protein
MPLYPDVQSMFAAHGVTAREAAFEHDGYSHAVMTRIEQGDRRYVVKRVSRTDDWIIQMTSDHAMREAQIAASDVLAPLAPGLRSPSIAAARDGDGFALLMWDLAPHLAGGDGPVPAELFELILARIARMHARFWEKDLASGIGWCGLSERVLMLSEPAGRRLQDAGLMEFGFGAGWEAFHRAVAPDVSALVRRLHADPGPLIEAMRALPSTLLHNDVKTGNVAIEGETLWLFDWALAGGGPVGCELGWLLAVNSSRLPWTLDETLRRYAACLADAQRAALPAAGWERQRAVAYLVGLLLLGWGKTAQPAELQWWCERGLEARSILRL